MLLVPPPQMGVLVLVAVEVELCPRLGQPRPLVVQLSLRLVVVQSSLGRLRPIHRPPITFEYELVEPPQRLLDGLPVLNDDLCAQNRASCTADAVPVETRTPGDRDVQLVDPDSFNAKLLIR